MHLDIVEIFLFLTTGGSIVLVALLLLPDQETLKAQRALKVRDESEENKYLLLKYTKVIYTFLTPHMTALALPRYRERKERALVKAGLRDIIDVDDFLALKCSLLLLVFVFKIISALTSTEALDVSSIVLWCVVGFFVPDIWLSMITKRRENRILRELPLFIDLLTLSVEAGLDFLAAITRIVEKQKDNLLVSEFDKMLREVKLGTSRADALRSLSQRLQVSQVSSFLSVLIQASQMGISIGGVLRIQSDLIREQRFQKAEKAGAQATQKLLFPLIFFILPALVLVIFGPIILDLMGD